MYCNKWLTERINGDIAATVVSLVGDDSRLLAVLEVGRVVEGRVHADGPVVDDPVRRVVRSSRAVAQRRVRDVVYLWALRYSCGSIVKFVICNL